MYSCPKIKKEKKIFQAVFFLLGPRRSQRNEKKKENIMQRQKRQKTNDERTAPAVFSPPPHTRLYKHALESIFAHLGLLDLGHLLATCRDWSAAVDSMRPINASVIVDPRRLGCRQQISLGTPHCRDSRSRVRESGRAMHDQPLRYHQAEQVSGHCDFGRK